MPRLTARRGAALAEMIVALTLSAIVSAVAAASFASTERYLRRSQAGSDARRRVREAEWVLASELRAAPLDSLRVRGDTALDLLGLVGVSVVCVSSLDVLVLPSDVAAGGVPYSSWRAAPEAGDLAAAFDTSGGGTWRTAIVQSAGTRSDGAGCGPSSGLLSAADSAARRPAMRVVLDAPFVPPVLVGAPVRFLRGARYALTRAADASWSLSYRRCSGLACGVAQPVVGPFAEPADSGLVFTLVEGESRIEAAIRTRVEAPLTVPESDRLRVTLRNHAVAFP